MAASHARHPNGLLASLPAGCLAELGTALEWAPMRLGQMLYEPGQRLSHVYFPSSAVVSLHCVTSSGASAETAGVGHEGVVGVPLFLGGETTCSSALVHTGGHGWRMDRHRLLNEFARGGVFRSTLLRYTQALIVQLVQTAACYRHHSVEQQLSAWLMATFDRMPAEDVVMTQELLGSLLGVRRESVSQAAGKLHGMGYIRYRRGHISVLDPAGLRANACECYGAVRREMRRLVPAVPAA
jgi:CRP-like cAMP-binding protein